MHLLPHVAVYTPASHELHSLQTLVTRKSGRASDELQCGTLFGDRAAAKTCMQKLNVRSAPSSTAFVSLG
jgi:hypothetical protein